MTKILIVTVHAIAITIITIVATKIHVRVIDQYSRKQFTTMTKISIRYLNFYNINKKHFCEINKMSHMRDDDHDVAAGKV